MFKYFSVLISQVGHVTLNAVPLEAARRRPSYGRRDIGFVNIHSAFKYIQLTLNTLSHVFLSTSQEAAVATLLVEVQKGLAAPPS